MLLYIGPGALSIDPGASSIGPGAFIYWPRCFYTLVRVLLYNDLGAFFKLVLEF